MERWPAGFHFLNTEPVYKIRYAQGSNSTLIACFCRSNSTPC